MWRGWNSKTKFVWQFVLSYLDVSYNLRISCISGFFLYSNCICLDTSYHFRLYLYFLNNVPYLFKYSCINIFYWPSLYTFYFYEYSACTWFSAAAMVCLVCVLFLLNANHFWNIGEIYGDGVLNPSQLTSIWSPFTMSACQTHWDKSGHIGNFWCQVTHSSAVNDKPERMSNVGSSI